MPVTDSDALPRRWYREPMLWLVIAIPLATALGGAVSLTLIVRHADHALTEVTPVSASDVPR